MRLSRLHIHRYGHFADATLDFPGEGLQVVHGRNEAGKSTLLQFVREILFGFGERNRYAFLGEKLEGSATLSFTNQQPMELRRRKGRPDALTVVRDEVPRSITESDLQSMLGGANSQLFQNVFAFGLSELAAGEESLRIDTVQHALHGGGLTGMGNPQKMLDLLTRESEEIFKERGSKQQVATLCNEIKTLTIQLKDKTVRSDVYLQRKRDHDAAKEEADRLVGQLSQLRRDHSRIKRLTTAYPLWRELIELQTNRVALGNESALTIEARSRFEKVLEDQKRLTREAVKLEREIQNADGELQQNPAQTVWLQLRAKIEQARELIVSVQEARQHLPLREAELTSDKQQVRQGLEELISTWNVEQLESFRCDAGQRHQCEQLAELKRELDNERIRLDERASTLAREQAANQADLKSVGELGDVTALQALLNKHADQVAREGRLAELLKDEGKQQRAITSQIRKLSPPLPQGSDDIESLPVLPVEQIKQYQDLFIAARQSLASAESSWQEACNRYDALVRELAAAKGSLIEIPTADGLKQSRAHRDAGWNLIEQRLNSGHCSEKEEADWLAGTNSSLSVEFRRSLVESDDYADRMFNNASLVHQQELVEEAAAHVVLKQQELDGHRQALSALEKQWHGLWQPCGFIPLDPDTMSAWKARHEQLLELIAKQADVHAEVKRLQMEIAAFNDRLAAALPGFAGTPDQCLAAIHERVQSRQQQAQDVTSYQRQTIKLQHSADQLAADRQSFEERTKSFHDQWGQWLTVLKFPSEWHPDLALTVVTRLQSLREKLQQIPALEGRIAAMRLRLAEFDPLVADLCDQVAPEWKSQTAEVAARQLADRLQAALETDSHRAGLIRELNKHRKKLDENKEQQQALRDEQQRLLDLAGSATDEDFFKEADRADAIRKVEAEITQKQRELAAARGTENEAAFLSELNTADFTALEASRLELEQQIHTLEEQERQANERKGATGKELEQLDGSAAAADIQATINQKRAALANAVDRYVPLLFARQLLQQTLQRFEKESQPELLNDVSQLFESLTGGRFHRVERPSDAGRPLIVYRSGSPDPLVPGELSTGTREQLYLAIRLAYVLHYCTKSEPLPIVLDDVFANFDPSRTRKSLEALGQITNKVQVLLFTCHPHVVALAQEVFPTLQPVEVPSPSLTKA